MARHLADHPPPTPQPTPCRIWQGAVDRDGYGRIYRDKRLQRAHRWVWEQVHGPIPEGMVIMHLCDSPPCFRLDHLQMGTHAENVADKVAKGRSAIGERSGNTRLTWDQVDEIRAAHAAGDASQRELGRRFGVGQSTISRIVRGEVWTKRPSPLEGGE